MSNSDFSSGLSVLGDDVASTAYYSLEPEMLERPLDALSEVNLDVIQAANTAMGVTPEVEKFLDRITTELPKFDATQVAKLPRAALALVFAHSLHAAATGKEDRLNPLYQEAVKLCDVLGDKARLQIKRGNLHANALDNLKRGVGYRNTQHDLQLLVNIFRKNRQSLAGKSVTTEDELARGEKLVSWLIQAVGLKEQGPVERAKTAEMLSRAFTLFTRTYSDLRRAIAYLLWHDGDVDKVIPSLYAGRGGSKKKEASDAASLTTPAAASNSPAATGAPNGLPNGANGGAGSDNDGGPFAS